MIQPPNGAPTPHATVPAELRVALIGAGRWGQRLLRVLVSTRGARLAALCDHDPEALRRAGMAAPGVPLFSNFEQLLGAPGVDAVVLATPSPTHANLAIEALSAARHVFVEKPMATCLDDALRVHARAKATPKKLMVGHVLEYHPSVTRLRAVIQSGTLGCVRLVCSERFGVAPTRSLDAWWELAPHDFSLFRHITEQEISSVAARRNGARGVAAVAALSGGTNARIDVGRSDRGPKVRRTIVVGSEGVALFDDVAQNSRLCVFPPQRGLVAWMNTFERSCALSKSRDARPDLGELAQFHHLSFVDAGEPLAIEVAHFVAGTLDSLEIRSDADSGLRVVSALDCGERSIAGGGRFVATALHAVPPRRAPTHANDFA